MLYAIQGPNVRFFFSEEEDKHLFSTFAQYEERAEVIIKGNWNEGLIFSSTIHIGHRPKDGSNGRFPIVSIPGETASIKTISTPLDYLKVSRLVVNHLPTTATIRCKKVQDRRELLVYPQIIEYQNEPEPSKIETNISATMQTTTLQSNANAIKPTIEANAEQSATTMSSEAWALELVNEINVLLVKNPTIAVVANDSGKDIKFVRKIIKRRQIV